MTTINLPIQYLRGIAALLVVSSHFKTFDWLNNFFGAIGVDIFFVISGYIMSLTIGKYVDRKNVFIRNRFIRIYPLYLLLSIPLFISLLLDGESIMVLKSLFFVGGGEKYHDPALFSGWTLFYEVCFYLILAFTMRNRSWTSIILVLMGVIGLTVPINSVLGYIFNSYFLLFFLGFNLASIEKFKSPVKSHLMNLLMASGLLILVMMFPDSAQHFLGDNYIPRQSVMVADLALPRVLFWGIPVVYFILSFKKYFENRKEIRVLRKLGDISYSIYLVHSLLYMLWIPWSSNIQVEYHVYVYNGLILSIIPLSLLTYELIEVRLSNFLKRKLSQGE